MVDSNTGNRTSLGFPKLFPKEGTQDSFMPRIKNPMRNRPPIRGPTTPQAPRYPGLGGGRQPSIQPIKPIQPTGQPPLGQPQDSVDEKLPDNFGRLANASRRLHDLQRAGNLNEQTAAEVYRRFLSEGGVISEWPTVLQWFEVGNGPPTGGPPIKPHPEVPIGQPPIGEAPGKPAPNPPTEGTLELSHPEWRPWMQEYLRQKPTSLSDLYTRFISRGAPEDFSRWAIANLNRNQNPGGEVLMPPHDAPVNPGKPFPIPPTPEPVFPPVSPPPTGPPPGWEPWVKLFREQPPTGLHDLYTRFILPGAPEGFSRWAIAWLNGNRNTYFGPQ